MFSTPVATRLTLAALLLRLAVPGPIAHATSPEVGPEEPVNLDQVTVEESRAELLKLKIARDDWDWQIGQIGDIEFISSASESDTRDIATRFFEFTQLVEWMVPAWRRVPSHPLRLVLCGARGSFDTLRPVATEDNTRDAVTAYLHDNAGAFIVADLEIKELNILETHGMTREGGFSTFGEPESDDAEITAPEYDSAGLPVATMEFLRRDYVRELMTSRGMRPPAWLSEGIAQLVATAKIENGKARIGRLTTQTVSTMANGQKADSGQASDLSLFFQGRAMMPLLEFFTISYDSPEYLNPIGSTFSGQSLGLVHFCLLGEKGKHQAAFLKWIDRLRFAPPSEDLFQECFGVSTKKFSIILRGYLTAGRYQSAVTEAGELPPPPAATVAPAHPADVARYKANIHRLTGRLDEARQVLATAISRGFTDAQLYDTLGMTALAQADYPTAIEAFNQARTLGSTDVHARLASVQARVLRQPDLSVGSSKELIQETLQIRANWPSPGADLPLILAEIFIRARLRPDPGFARLLDNAVVSFPSNAPLGVAVAKLHARIGENDLAVAMLRRGAEHANSPEDRAAFLAAIDHLDGT